MDDPLLVARVERVGYLRRNLESHGKRQRTAHEPGGERAPFDQLQDEASEAVMLDKAVNGPDVRVVERGQEAGPRSNRARRVASPNQCWGRILIATSRPRCGSRAR